ncbi:hypothetical protein ACFOOM_27175 [Streptomyces echinoruber]|uniref:Uncharacterized protein n=1 Tax=Streptomyces echinoruber TaxID=68898 RepID=A0A918RE82_9ACTN|nr:hypothetical protein [Streptomyces echinoruber]GGZ94662.1 hypothetical protein GCM10010389_37040 [Streptomyces echinoruber]
MTAPAVPSRWPARGAAGTRRIRWSAPHPITVLRRLRTGVLAMVVATALLYLLVSAQAGDRIAAARRTSEAVHDLRLAAREAGRADTALQQVSHPAEMELIGTGTEFANTTARVSVLITSAAENNAAGKQGLNQIQFAQGQLTTCVQLANAALRGDARSGPAQLAVARATLTDPGEKDPTTHTYISGTGGLISSLQDLQKREGEALDDQLRSPWLTPGWVWTLLLGPVAVMAVLVVASGCVVVRHFRRHPDPRLLLALLATAAAGTTAGLLCRLDTHRLGTHLLDMHRFAPHPLADHPVTMALVLPLLAAAGALAYLAYRPRLAEYRFPRS